MNCIFIESKDEKNHIAIVEDDILVEYLVEDLTQKNVLKNIYRARVENVLKGMEAAFVNIGQSKNAYLYLRDALDEDQRKSGEKHKIDELLKIGDDVIVQVTKEALGSKGAKVTTNLSLRGTYIVITPYKRGINVSKKIQDSKERGRLSKIGKQFKKDQVGVIFRTNSKGIDEEIIVKEYNELLSSYKNIEMQRNFLPTPKLIYRELDLVKEAIRDYSTRKGLKIIVNNKELYDNIYDLREALGINAEIDFDKDLDFKYNRTIQKGLKIALSKSVKLESGGSIVIESTEALTAIDVNTHKYTGSSSLDKTVRDTNLEAAKEIARQIKLRNIGGIIIVDFIDMKNDSDIKDLMDALEDYFKKDKNKPLLIDITKLGLIELTRKKERPSLEAEMLNKCPTCEGRGKVK